MMDFSVLQKSPSYMCATYVFDSGHHSPIECGFSLAYSLTGAATRLSELPSRNTGFAAEPKFLA